MTVSTEFAPTRAGTLSSKAPGQECALFVRSFSDDRREPAILGSVAGRAIRAPEDSDAWLRSMLTQLEARGLRVVFGDPPADAVSPVTASVHLKIAWVSTISTSKTGTAVVQVTYARGGGPAWERSYRGSHTAMNWGSGDDEVQRLIERVLNQVLDQMGADVHAACGGQPEISG